MLESVCLKYLVGVSQLAKALNETRLSVQAWSGWPAEDFADKGGLNRNYFRKNLHRPSVWTFSTFLDAAKTKIMDLCQVFQGSVPWAVYELVRSTPTKIQDECEEILYARQYRKCIQHALQWGGLPVEIIYLPIGTADSIAKESILGTNGNTVGSHLLVTGDDNYEDEHVKNEDPNNKDNPSRTPEKAGQNGFDEPQAIFVESRTVSPVVPPMMNTPTPGMVLPPSTGTGLCQSLLFCNVTSCLVQYYVTTYSLTAHNILGAFFRHGEIRQQILLERWGTVAHQRYCL
jgi:hypothetical protein